MSVEEFDVFCFEVWDEVYVEDVDFSVYCVFDLFVLEVVCVCLGVVFFEGMLGVFVLVV